MKNNVFNVLRLSFVALTLFFGAACADMNKTTQGAIGGTMLGAGMGAIVGSATGDEGRGTAIGAALGGIGGGLVGNSLDGQDRQNKELTQRLDANERLLEENKRLIEELRKRGADVRSSRRGVVVNLPDILFEFDSYQLTPEARRTLGEISEVLRDSGNRTIAVEGHTDSIGPMIYNKQLSLNRATSVARELDQRGVRRQRIRIEGYGEGAPIATNNTEAGRARNRRVEVIIENPGQ